MIFLRFFLFLSLFPFFSLSLQLPHSLSVFPFLTFPSVFSFYSCVLFHVACVKHSGSGFWVYVPLPRIPFHVPSSNASVLVLQVMVILLPILCSICRLNAFFPFPPFLSLLSFFLLFLPFPLSLPSFLTSCLF